MTLYTVRDVAELLKLSERKVYDIVSSGKLSAYKIGGSIRVSEEDLLAYLEDSRLVTRRTRRRPRRRQALKHIDLS